jgi:photosystem II stability/assembly factor-like uncharacterized protein
VIWTGSDDGRLHVTRDGGATWTSVEKNVPGVPANTWIPHITPSTHSGGQAFVVFDNHRRGDFTPYLYRTDDYGKTWKSLATKDLKGWALALAQDPVRKDLLFLGTELGLWVSFDGGAKWLPFRHGVPTASVMDLAIHPRELDLVIGTHGRALYILDDIRPLRDISEATLAEPLHLYGIADAQQHWVDPEPGGFSPGSGAFRGENEPYGALVTFSLNDATLPLPDEKKERERKLAERQALRIPPPTPESKPAKPAGKPEVAGKTAGAVEPKPEEQTKEKDAKEPAKEVEIRVKDASGTTVRTFTAPVKLGVNRVAWDLRSDGAKPFPQEGEPEPHPAGFEVGPGTYTATVKFKGKEASGTFKVVADPRTRYSETDWQRRAEALRKVQNMLEALAEAARRLRSAEAAVDLALARREPPKEGEKEAEKKDDKESADPLAEAAGKLKESLKKAEKKVWVPYDNFGLVGGRDSASTLAFNAAYYLSSSYAPPSPNLEAHVASAERAVAAALAEANRVFSTEMEEFRRQVEEAGIGLLTPGKPLEVKP